MKLAAGLYLVFLASGLGAAATRGEVRHDLDQTKLEKKQLDKKLLQSRLTVKQHAKEEKNILGQIYGNMRELSAAKRDMQVHVKNLTLVEDRLATLKVRQDQTGAQERADRAALRVQLRAVQHSRARQGAALLFSARTPAQWSARSNALREISLGTQRKVQGLRRRLDQLEGYRQEYAQRESELGRRRGDAEGARQRVLKAAILNQALLKEVRLKKATAQSVVNSLEQTAKRVQDVVNGLQRETQRLSKIKGKPGNRRVVRTTDGPSTLRTRVAWPVMGKLLSTFGKHKHPVFNVNVFNRGIEIAAPFGASIKAVASGTVEYVGEMPDFGKLVVVDHGGGLKSVYGYGSKSLVNTGDEVAQGDAVAEVGEHGSTGQPALYFQISKSAKPQDPLRYLTRRP